MDETPVTKYLCNEGVSSKHSLAVAVNCSLGGSFYSETAHEVVLEGVTVLGYFIFDSIILI